MSRSLFVLKYRALPYGGEYGSDEAAWGETPAYDRPLHSGLYNSARFVVDMLVDNCVNAKIVHVVDNNAIHKEIVGFSDFANNDPVTDVIIEAFWVVPEKFIVLKKACPYVKRWIIRNHSETPFLANEGMAFDWIIKYLTIDVAVSCNAPRMLGEVRALARIHFPEWTEEKIVEMTPYLPNFYPLADKKHCPSNDEFLDIGCFGAVRPLKNTVMQAIASMVVADKMGKKLRFHINGGRIEMGGSPILRNLKCLFENSPGHVLISHDWQPHDQFLKLVSKMDMVLQVSFSETFNIVAADAVSQGVPVVLSREIPWSNCLLTADPTSSEDIILKMQIVILLKKWFPDWNLNIGGIERYNKSSTKLWVEYLTCR